MSVDLRNYVNININYHETQPLNRTRDTAVLISLEDIRPVNEEDEEILEKIYNSFIEFTSDFSSLTPETNPLYNYVETFFNNGGVKLKILYKGSEDNVEDEVTYIVNKIKLLPAENIVITSTCEENIMRQVVTSKETIDLYSNYNLGETTINLSGYKEKIYISSTTNDDYTIEPVNDYNNYIIKYGLKGIELSIAAYLTKINITQADSINDYCYTIESLSDKFKTYVVDDNDKAVKLMGKNINFDTTLANNTRNVMGNTISGYNIMNYYIRIILIQTLTNRILNTLVSKIKYNRTGINKVITAITQELNIYKTNGYLNTNFIWTEDDLYYNFNGNSYLVCARNTPLVQGYKFIILPFSSLTQEQRDKNVFPPIYLLIADSNYIRQIIINGDAY